MLRGKGEAELDRTQLVASLMASRVVSPPAPSPPPPVDPIGDPALGFYKQKLTNLNEKLEKATGEQAVAEGCGGLSLILIIALAIGFITGFGTPFLGMVAGGGAIMIYLVLSRSAERSSQVLALEEEIREVRAQIERRSGHSLTRAGRNSDR